MKNTRWLSYSSWIGATWVLLLFVRIVETILVKQHHFVTGLIQNECTGFLLDIVSVSAFLVFLFPIFYLLQRGSAKAANIFMGVILSLVLIAHLSIIQYYGRVLHPLGSILITHSLQEVLFTIRSSDSNYFTFGVGILLGLLFLLGSWKLLNRVELPVKLKLGLCVFALLCLIGNIFITKSFAKVEEETPPYSIRLNKSYYFYKNTANFLLHPQNLTDQNFDPEGRNLLFPGRQFVSQEFPLLAESDFTDLLGPFLNKTSNEQPPNLVFIIVEGLGAHFMGDFHGLHLMSFLDSLVQKSLYWDKAVTVGERSFNVVPSLITSAPYGKKGFASESEKTYDLSLVNMLSKYNYYTTFFYGQPKWFHDKGPFLKRNGLDKFVDCDRFPDAYHRIMVGDYFWGYDDKDLVRYAQQVISDSLPESPRLEMYFTGSMHQPFIIQDRDKYDQKLDDLVLKSNLSKDEKAFIQKYRKFIRSILFANDALRELFLGYQKHPSYENTIFIITGDHNMADIPVKNTYMRYRVPLIIYSPLLKQAKTFHSVNSHLDVAPTLLAYLHQNYGVALPKQNAFIGKLLDTAAGFRNTQPIAFMNGDRVIIDLLYENYFLSNAKTLFKIDQDDRTTRIDDPAMQQKLAKMLQNFNALNTYCCANYKLIPDSIYYSYSKNEMLYQSMQKVYQMPIGHEYGDIIPEMEITEAGEYYLDFEITSAETLQKNCPSLVLDIKKPDNENFLWNGANLYNEKKRVRMSFTVKPSDTKPLKLKAYFWDKEKSGFKISNASCHLYCIKKYPAH